jgi:formate-dependent nitrite reductase membrane component NrfD
MLRLLNVILSLGRPNKFTTLLFASSFRLEERE